MTPLVLIVFGISGWIYALIILGLWSLDMSEGQIRNGYQGHNCARSTCRVPLTTETEAFLHKDRESGKFFMFCGACSVDIDLNHSLRLPKVIL